jgi:hypothetical protein
MNVYILLSVVSVALLCARWIGIATGEERAMRRVRTGRERIAHRTSEAQKRRWLKNGEALEIFERAFSDRTAGCARQCNCGVQFYALEWAVGTVYFEGKFYVPDCSCWHERAKAIIAFMHHHDDQIADFLSLEKTRLEFLAKHAPTVA